MSQVQLSRAVPSGLGLRNSDVNKVVSLVLCVQFFRLLHTILAGKILVGKVIEKKQGIKLVMKMKCLQRS